MAVSRPISTLPAALQSIIRSTTIVTSLPQIVLELIQNSLDANASHVDVGVDTEQWQCWVRDDGCGVDRALMNLLANGSEKGRYGTSKAYSPTSLENVSSFGFRGEALASAADVSCLEISSRTSASRETWSVILKGGKKLYYGPAVRWKREKHGTTVFIRDAFYNLPIRRRSHPNPTRSLELIRRDLESVALVFPGVSFSLENTAKGRGERNGRGRVLTIPKTPSSLAAFRHLFGRALCEHVEEVDTRRGDMRIQGFLSLQGAHSKIHQFLYVNRHALSHCELHRTIDARLAASSFGKNALDEAGMTRSPAPGLRRSPRKNERHPIYVLNVTIPPRFIDNYLEPTKVAVNFETPEAVLNLVSEVVLSFLIRNGFSSGDAKTRKSTTSECHSPPSKRRKFSKDHDGELEANDDHTHVRGAISKSQKAMIDTHLTADPTNDGLDESDWADPATGMVYKVDIRTGNSYPLIAGRDAHEIYDQLCCGRNERRMMVDTRRLRKRPSSAHVTEDALPDWIVQALNGWENPTYGIQEPGVPCLTSLPSFSRRLHFQSDAALRSDLSSRYFDPVLTTGRANNAVDVSATFDKAHLKTAEVLGQVDEKFIACVITSTTMCTKTLVLVDQHAADERIRVEEYLGKLCEGFLKHDICDGVDKQVIHPPIPILLTSREARRLSRSKHYQKAFERWGFCFAQMSAIGQEDEVDEYVQVLVETIPDIVSEKLSTGDELRELVKGFLAKLEAEGDSYAVAPSNASEMRWITALRWCPKELIDLVNSKACRSAIMFNDPLDIEQCQRLISQLSETVWPFMCAHGRPSIAPLTNVNSSAEGRMKVIDWSNIATTLGKAIDNSS